MPVLIRSAVLGSILGGVVVAAVTAKNAQETGMSARAAEEWTGASVASAIAQTPVLVCGGFSEEGRYANLEVAWSFRLCESTPETYEYQLRFRNLSDRSVEFGFRVWVREPETCGRRGSGEPALRGIKRLHSGQLEEWPYAAGEVLRARYQGRIWSCADVE
jgi:hypothetical protein